MVEKKQPCGLYQFVRQIVRCDHPIKRRIVEHVTVSRAIYHNDAVIRAASRVVLDGRGIHSMVLQCGPNELRQIVVTETSRVSGTSPQRSNCGNGRAGWSSALACAGVNRYLAIDCGKI